MMLIGIIWAVAAPLLLLPPIALLAWLLVFTGWQLPWRIAVAAVVVALAVGALWWSDYQDYRAVCERIGTPRIFARAVTDGIFLDSGTANSFGMNYLHQQGFTWLEMRSIYDRSKFDRVTRAADGTTSTERIDAITARYEVRETFKQPTPHISIDMRRVIDRQDGRLLAQAGSAHFDGGRAKWVLGMYGSRHYPDALTHGEDFNAYYYLAQRTLRPPKP